MTKRYCTEEEVRHTVEVTFFQCIKRYEKKDSEKGPIPFSAFLYSYFFYLLKKNVDTFLIDQLGRKSFPLMQRKFFWWSEKRVRGSSNWRWHYRARLYRSFLFGRDRWVLGTRRNGHNSVWWIICTGKTVNQVEIHWQEEVIWDSIEDYWTSKYGKRTHYQN